MSRMDRWVVAYANQLLQWRWWAILLSLLLVVLALSGVKNLRFDTNYRVFFSEENPQLKAFDELQAVYTKTDNILFVLQSKEPGADVFEPNMLKAIQELTEGAWQLPFSTRVDSITNYQHTYAEGDNLNVVDLVDVDPDELTEDQLGYIRAVALEEPLLVDRVISKDGRTTGVNVTISVPEKSPFEVPQTAAAARELLAKIQAKYPGIEMRASGMIMMNNAFSESSQDDMKLLVPLMYFMLVLVMYLVFRSFSITLSIVFVIAFSAMFAMGVAGWFHVGLTPPSASAPTVILTLAIADSIHIAVSMFKEMQRGSSKREALIESLRINFQPVLLTTVTTIIGFLSLNFSEVPPFRHLGNITAVGVAAAFIFSVFFLPALIDVLPVKCKVRKEGGADFMLRLGEFVVAKRKKLFWGSLVFIGLAASMIPKIELNDQFIQYFDYSIPFRGDSEFVLDNLTGLYQVEYSINAKENDGISDPEYLQNLEKFAQWLRAQQEVVHVYSMTDIFKRLNKNMHGDDPEWYRLPDTREMAAQYLLLYEFSLPYGLDLNDRINVDKSATRLSVTLIDMSTKEMRAFKDRSEQWLRDNAPEYMQTEATGSVVMFAYISQRNIESMMKGNAFALVLISFSIMVVLWSVRIGLYSLIPNLVPAIVGFGIWGLLVGQVNMAVAIIAAVSLGIIVDDTVHFLSKYYRARREKHDDPAHSVTYAFSTVGAALLITTCILIAGFSVLIFSGFALNNVMGMLTAIVIGMALVIDFFFLPPLILLLEKKGVIDDKT